MASPAAPLKLRLNRALQDFSGRIQSDALVQVWMPEQCAAGVLMSAHGLPFAIVGAGDSLALFRCISVRYRFSTDPGKPALMGAVGRVYATSRPEVCHRMQQQSEQVCLRATGAHRCQVHSTIVIPIYDRHGLDKPLAVLELVQSTKDVVSLALLSWLKQSLENMSLFSSEPLLDEVPFGPKRSEPAGAGLYTGAPACCSPAMQRCASGPQARLDLDTATTSTAPPWPFSAAASDHCRDSRDERPGLHKDSTARQQPSTAWASLPGTPLAGQARCQVDRPLCSRPHSGDQQADCAWGIALLAGAALGPQLNTPGRPRAAHLGQQAGFLALHTLPALPIGTPLVSTPGGGKAGAGKEASVQQLVVRLKQNGSSSDVLQSHSPHTNTKPAFGPAAGGRGGKADTVACSRKPSVVAGGEEEEEFSSEGGREEGEDDGSDSQGAGVHNNRVGGGAGKRLRFEDLQAQFGLGLKDAANNLGICATTLKRACRRHNIKRWPRRQIAKLNRALASAVTAQLKAVERAPVQLKGQDKGQAGSFWPWTTGATNSGGGGTSSAPGSEDSQRLLLSSVPQVAPPLQPRGLQGSLKQLGSQADASAATQHAQVQALQIVHAQLLLIRQQQLAQASGGSLLQPGMPCLSPSPHVSGGTPMMHSDSLSQSSKQSGCSTQQPATQPSLTAVIDRSCMQSSSAAPPTSVHSMPHQQHLDQKQQQQFQDLQHQQQPQQQPLSPNQSLQLTHTAQPRSPNPLPLSPPFLSNGGLQAPLFMLNDLANASAVAARGPALIQELCAQPHQPAHLQAQLGPTTPATSSLLGLGHHSSMQISSSSLLSLMNKHSVGSLMHPEELNALVQPLSGVSDLLAGMGMVPEGSSVNPTPTLHMDCSQQQQQQAGTQGGGEPGTRHTGQQGQGQADCAMFMPGSMFMPGQWLGGLGQGQGQHSHSQSQTLAALHELFKNTPGSRETVMELLSEDLFLAQGHGGSC